MKKLKKQIGGNISNTGYLNDSPDRFNPYNIIPSNIITMNNVNQNIMAYPDKGKPKLMKKNSGLHKFPGANFIKEIPVAQNGGFTRGLIFPEYIDTKHGSIRSDAIPSVINDLKTEFSNNSTIRTGGLSNPLNIPIDKQMKTIDKQKKIKQSIQYYENLLKNSKMSDEQIHQELYKSYVLPPDIKMQNGGQPRLVNQVPDNYIPYPQMGANYYHNPKSSAKGANNTSGPKMSNAAWAAFVKSNPNWNQQNSDDIVYTQNSLMAQPPQQVADQPSFMNMTEHMFTGNRAVGASGWNEKKSNTITNDGQQNVMGNNPNKDFVFYKNNTAEPDPTKVYRNIPADVWSNQMTHGTNNLQDTTGMYKYRVPINTALVKKQKGGLIKAQQGLTAPRAQLFMNENQPNNFLWDDPQSNIIYPNRINIPQYDPNQTDQFKTIPQNKGKVKRPGFKNFADVMQLGLSALGNATEQNSNNRNYQTILGGSDSQYGTYAGNRGDYTTNEGYFKPNQQVPIQFGSAIYDEYGIPRASLGLTFNNDMNTSSLREQMPDFGNSSIPVSLDPLVAPNVNESTDRRSKGTDIATKTNNPGNMKYHSWMSKFGGINSGIPGKDGGTFAEFPDLQSGLKAYQTQLFGTVDGVMSSSYYKPNTTVDQALKTWSNNAYGAEIYPELKGKTLSEVNSEQRLELSKRQIKKESNKMYTLLNNEGVFNTPTASFNVNGQAGLNNASSWAINLGNTLQDYGKNPLSVNSIYRTSEHNQKVGGKPNSQHLKGTALDIKPSYWNKLNKSAQNQILTNFNAKAIDEGDHIHIQKSYQEGGEYEMDEREIQSYLANGGQIEYL